MNNLQAGLLSAAVVLSTVVSASLLANAIEHRQFDYSDAGRWTVQQNYTDGWLLLDSATGQLCSVPNAQNADQTPHCAPKP